MYYQLIETPLAEEVERELPEAVDPELCTRLVDEPDLPRSLVELTFHIGLSCLHVDYLPIRNVSRAMLCSQRFINVLTSMSVPFTTYLARLLEWNTEHLIAVDYFFWLPQQVKDTIDWEHSEDWVDYETGARWLTKLVLTAECEAAAPLLFHAKGSGRYFVHDRLRTQLEAAGITGVTFVPLDDAYNPYAGLKRLELERILQEHPDDWVGWCKLSDTLVTTRRYKEALEPLNRALALKPDLEIAWYKQGRILHRLGYLQEALEALKRAIELKPQSLACGEYWTVLRKLGRQEEALATAEQWVKIWGKSPLPWYELGAAHAVLEHYEEALYAIERGLALGGGARLDDLFRVKADVLYKLGRYEEALATCEVRLQATPLVRAIWEVKAKSLHALGRNKEALEAEEELHKLEQRRLENLSKKPK